MLIDWREPGKEDHYFLTEERLEEISDRPKMYHYYEICPIRKVLVFKASTYKPIADYKIVFGKDFKEHYGFKGEIECNYMEADLRVKVSEGRKSKILRWLNVLIAKGRQKSI